MLTAAMAGDRAGFLDSHRKALDAARAQVANDPRISSLSREKEAEARVLLSWRSRDPVSIFRFKPTAAQMAALFANMDDQGRQDVQEALRRFHQFSDLITPTPAERRYDQQISRLRARRRRARHSDSRSTVFRCPVSIPLPTNEPSQKMDRASLGQCPSRRFAPAASSRAES